MYTIFEICFASLLIYVLLDFLKFTNLINFKRIGLNLIFIFYITTSLTTLLLAIVLPFFIESKDFKDWYYIVYPLAIIVCYTQSRILNYFIKIYDLKDYY